MKRIQVGDMVASDYGKGHVVAVTKQWVIHDNSLNNRDDEFAVLLSDDTIQLIDIKVPVS